MTAPLDQSFDVSKLNRIQKLAILLILLGPESASQILRNLEESEMEAVSAEIARQTMIPLDAQEEILREFTEVALMATTFVRGGVEYTQSVLERAVGVSKASNVISRVAPVRPKVPAMTSLAEVEPRQLFNALKHEQPQTIALVLSYLPAEKASGLMGMLKEDLREQVIERLATLSATPIEVVERVLAVISQRLNIRPTRALNQSGGLKSAADLLNAMDRNVTKAILVSIEEKNPELGAAIRQKMFTFEDLARLEIAALQKIMREVDMRDLAISLKTASDHLRQALFSAISKRAAESVKEEMGFLGALKLKEIEAAQLRIIEIVRRLENEGEIELTSMHENAEAIAA